MGGGPTGAGGTAAPEALLQLEARRATGRLRFPDGQKKAQDDPQGMGSVALVHGASA